MTRKNANPAELGYGMTCSSDSFVPRWLMKAQPLSRVAIKGFGQEEQGPELCKFITLYQLLTIGSIGF